MTTTTKNTTIYKLQQFYEHVQKWTASIYFIENEIQFITKKLHSYTVEPTTPNLFEQLQDLKFEITAIEKERLALMTAIHNHEIEIKTILSLDATVVNDACIEDHEFITTHFNQFYSNFQTLKVKVLEYTGGRITYSKEEVLQYA